MELRIYGLFICGKLGFTSLSIKYSSKNGSLQKTQLVSKLASARASCLTMSLYNQQNLNDKSNNNKSLSRHDNQFVKHSPYQYSTPHQQAVHFPDLNLADRHKQTHRLLASDSHVFHIALPVPDGVNQKSTMSI